MNCSEDEIKDWLKLAFSENVGPITFRDLISYFGSPKEAIRHIGDLSKQGGRRRPITLAKDKQIEEEIQKAREKGVKILISKDPDFPDLLRQIEDTPPVLFTLGDSYLLKARSIGIVGSRNASINGQNLTKRIAYDLVMNNFTIISGMAKGIDSSAHEGALRNTTDCGYTVAVLGTGVDEIYPKENTELYYQIKERGCLVSELPMGTVPSPRNFPRRNRIISGLCEGVLVVEAHIGSGSLITAEEALSQNREVFAVPGSPLDPRSAGPNKLIREGAALVSSAQDIIQLLNKPRIKDFHLFENEMVSLRQGKAIFDDQAISKARKILEENLTPEVTNIDSLIRETGMPTDLVNVALVQMELAGRIVRYPGHKVALIYE